MPNFLFHTEIFFSSTQKIFWSNRPIGSMDPTLELETFTIFCRSGERHSSAKEVAADQLTRADDAAAAAAATGSLPF